MSFSCFGAPPGADELPDARESPEPFAVREDDSATPDAEPVLATPFKLASESEEQFQRIEDHIASATDAAKVALSAAFVEAGLQRQGMQRSMAWR